MILYGSGPAVKDVAEVWEMINNEPLNQLATAMMKFSALPISRMVWMIAS